MRVAVIGSREFDNFDLLKSTLDNYYISKLVSGGADGADHMGEMYAVENRIKTLIFRPDYDKHGQKAPIIRNKAIIDNSDFVIAFWDGKSKGTKYAIDYAKKLGKELKMVGINGAQFARQLKLF